MKKNLYTLSLITAALSFSQFAQADARFAAEGAWSKAAYDSLQILATAPGANTDPKNPGSNVYPYASFTVQDFKTTDGKNVRLWIPNGASGKLPLLAFGPGKSLSNATNYQAMFEHAAKKGMVVANIQFEGSFLDTDFVKFAGWFNNAVKQTLARVTQADPAQVWYAGHSLGSQVAVIAAARATTLDTANAFVDPKGMLLMAYDNSNGPSNPGNLNDPALGYAVKVGSQVRAMIFEFEDDSIAGPAKNYAQALYNKLPSAQRQWVRVKGKTLGSYGLEANHNTPLTGGGAPLGIGGAAKNNALDWYMVWKAAAGMPLSTNSADAASHLSGAALLHGGIASDGKVMQHQLMGQSF
ncbi:hypothetical protein V8J88_23770 [Massilia sp. W12]|uniref:lipase family protein n=1 Tax=Massilia sp. W12 TaxID=3126507 RepID=UPI0030CDD232